MEFATRSVALSYIPYSIFTMQQDMEYKILKIKKLFATRSVDIFNIQYSIFCIFISYIPYSIFSI